MNYPDIKIAVQIYYEKPELTSADIKKIFNCCNTTATKLKNEVKEAMATKGVRTWRPGNINTKIAFEVWGIDVKEYEERLESLSRLREIENSISKGGKRI